LEKKERLVPLYLKVREGIKERLEKAAKEKGYIYLADFAGELLEKALGEPRQAKPEKAETVQRLIGTMKLKTCRHLGEDGYCSIWQLSKEDGEHIFGEEAKELLELRVYERSQFFTVVKVEEYGLKPSLAICFYCPFYEKRY
jgi:hypothetical protein